MNSPLPKGLQSPLIIIALQPVLKTEGNMLFIQYFCSNTSYVHKLSFDNKYGNTEF